MAQGQRTRPSRATQSLSSNNPRTLNENQRIEKRPDGSVWLVTQLTETRKDERRIDSERDADSLAKGNEIWWHALLKQQEERDKPAPKKKAPAKRKEENDNE